MGLLKRLFDSLSNPEPEEEYGIQSTTLTGERVRSRAEQTVADYFTKQNIVYQYEQTAKTNDLIFKKEISRPDFYLPEYDVYVEYWGLVDADNPEVQARYERTMKWKMAQYYSNNIRFISIYPKNLDNLDWIFRAKFKQVAGFDLPKKTDQGTQSRSRYCTSCGRPVGTTSRFCGNCGKRVAG